MMRSFSSRSDTFVTDEPFYACYLQRTGLQHPGREEILRFCKRDYRSIINDITSPPVPAGKKVWYQKHMAHHLEHDDSLAWTKDLINCLLIRTPAEVVSSFSKKNELTDVNELGYLQQIQLYRYHNNKLPVVDAQDILQDPSGILSNLCARCGIPYEKGMLSWAAGPHPADGIWGKYWYDQLWSSTGFKPYVQKKVTVSSALAAMVDQCMPLYEELYQDRITTNEK
jgi:hypothetical protein